MKNLRILENWRKPLVWLLPVAAITALFVGVLWRNPGLLGGGAVALCALWKAPWLTQERERLFALSSRKASGRSTTSTQGTSRSEGKLTSTLPLPSTSPARPASRTRRGESALADLVDEMISQSRYALLLRPEVAQQLSPREVEEVLAVMDEYMSVVPAGRVLVGDYADRATWGASPTTGELAGVEAIDGCYLDRYAITNAQYQHFVDAGGYEQFALWHEEALPALFEFVDRTGVPAPAHWSDGRLPEGEETLPVVGISWYEASAYARWVGKRLPTDAEWTKAGAWPVETSPGRITQRRYPWGDTFESHRAALWASGRKGPVPVDAFPVGASLGGVQQLIGNVWEWTSTPLDATSREHSSDSHALKVIHGGAFNTYFENQATCHFRSGERPLARRFNVGMRLALSFDTVADPDGGAPADESSDLPVDPTHS
jgi:iron(II)-dependent oxidoreductase